jgi:predicted  nucleic acid-binding Zn-ribbon protein
MGDISVISKKINNLKAQIAKEQGQLEAFKQRREVLINQLRALGITPNSLPEHIANIESQLEDLESRLERQLAEIEAKRRSIVDELKR